MVYCIVKLSINNRISKAKVQLAIKQYKQMNPHIRYVDGRNKTAKIEIKKEIAYPNNSNEDLINPFINTIKYS